MLMDEWPPHTPPPPVSPAAFSTIVQWVMVMVELKTLCTPPAEMVAELRLMMQLVRVAEEP